MRIDRFLSHMNVGTRKTLKPLLKAGRVHVADKVIKEAKYQVTPETVVYVDDEPIRYQTNFYWLLKIKIDEL